MSNEQVEREGLASIVSDALAELLGQQPGGPAREDYKVADAVLAAGFHLTPTPQVVETVAELEALPIAVVVRSAAGTIGSRLSATEGVCFGIEASFPWRNLSLPATVLYPHPTPDVDVLAEVRDAWDEGFATGVDAGGRYMEQGGLDSDDVNPYAEAGR